MAFFILIPRASTFSYLRYDNPYYRVTQVTSEPDAFCTLQPGGLNVTLHLAPIPVSFVAHLIRIRACI